MATEPHHSAEPDGDHLEMPAPTLWPLVLAAAVTLMGAGIVTNYLFTAVGAGLFVIALAYWLAQLVPGQGEHVEERAPPEERARPVLPKPSAVERLQPGMAGHRMRIPEKFHPYSAGVKGGIVGGLVMPIPALLYGIVSGHGIWYPVNLLVGMVVQLPTLEDGSLNVAELEKFHPGWFVGALFIHAILSVSLGLMYGVLLPMLGNRPLLWGGIVAPLLWTGLSYGFMGVLNPALADGVNWPSFIVSQFIFGITVGIVVVRSEQVYSHDVAFGSGRPSQPPPAGGSA